MIPYQNRRFTTFIQVLLITLALLLQPAAIRAKEVPAWDRTADCSRLEIYANLKATRLATIRGSKPFRLLIGNSYADCPSNKQICLSHKMVRPKEPLLVAKRFKQYTCALSVNSKYQEIAGWIPIKNLNIQPVRTTAVPISKWQGWWRDPDQLRSIEISRAQNGKLLLLGNGIYPGHYWDSVTKAWAPEPYYRNFKFTAQANSNPFIYQEPVYWTPWRKTAPEPRSIEFFTLGKYLLVNDRLDLGGNVNFSAIYQKFHGKPVVKTTKRQKTPRPR